MRNLLSPRREKFYRLVREANEQPSSWLVAALTDPTRNNGYMSALARLACLRILVCRNDSGLPYPYRKTAVRFEIGIPNPRWVSADDRTKELIPGAILMSYFQSGIHVRYDMTIAQEGGSYVPVHGCLRMAAVDSIAKAKAVLLQYWKDLPDAHKTICSEHRKVAYCG